MAARAAADPFGLFARVRHLLPGTAVLGPAVPPAADSAAPGTPVAKGGCLDEDPPGAAALDAIPTRRPFAPPAPVAHKEIILMQTPALDLVARTSMRAALAAELAPAASGLAPPGSGSTAPLVERPPGGTPVVPGLGRRTRLALPPAARRKLDRLEALAAAARSESFRLGELLEAERDHQRALAGTEATWAANYFRDVTAADRERLAVDRQASAQEMATLQAQRQGAAERWTRSTRLVEHCRAYLGLPRHGRRG
jgi:hypothetical protein